MSISKLLEKSASYSTVIFSQTEEEMEKEMQCDEIKKINDEHIQFRRSLEIEMLGDLKAISQSEVIITV